MGSFFIKLQNFGYQSLNPVVLRQKSVLPVLLFYHGLMNYIIRLDSISTMNRSYDHKIKKA